MLRSFKINNYDILTDNRIKAVEFSGLQPAGSTTSSASVGGNKVISSSIRTNRTITVAAFIVRNIHDAINDIYTEWVLGEPLTIEITTEDGETFTETGIIKDIDIKRYDSKVPVLVTIDCYTAFFYKSQQTFDSSNSGATMNAGNLNQNNIIITHTIGAGETSFTVDFFGTTTVIFDGDYSGQTAVIDCQEQTFYIDGVNKFWLVTNWQDGSSGTINIPANTTVIYKKTVRGLW